MTGPESLGGRAYNLNDPLRQAARLQAQIYEALWSCIEVAHTGLQNLKWGPRLTRINNGDVGV